MNCFLKFSKLIGMTKSRDPVTSVRGHFSNLVYFCLEDVANATMRQTSTINSNIN